MTTTALFFAWITAVVYAGMWGATYGVWGTVLAVFLVFNVLPMIAGVIAVAAQERWLREDRFNKLLQG
jgi:phage-related holin